MTFLGLGTAATVLANIFGSKDSDNNNIIANVNSKEGRELLIANGNMISLIDKLLIEPKLIISKELENVKGLDKIIDYQLTVFTSLYVKSFKYMVEQLGVNVDVALSLLSSTKGTVLKDINKYTMESYNYSSMLDGLVSDDTITTEDSGKGKELPLIKEVTIKLNGGSTVVEINVLIKASLNYVSSRSLELLLDSRDKNKTSFWTRLDEAKSGEISWGNFFFPTDLLKRHRQQRLMDSEDLIKEIREDIEASNLKLVTEGSIGFGKNHRMFIVNREFKDKIRTSYRVPVIKGGALKFLNEASSLSIAFVDIDREVVEQYLSSTKGSLVFTIKEISKNSNNKQDDILAFLAGMK